MPNLLTVQLAVMEIEQYAHQLIELIEPLSEEQLWSKKGGIPNSIGTLSRHLTGNLNHYFGVGILKNDYIRKRDIEFTETNLPKSKVIADLQAAVKIARQAIEAIDEEEIYRAYTDPDGVEHESLAYHIVRLTTHFALHYGQADYTKHHIT